MEHIDREKAQRVWQRVQAQQNVSLAPQRPGLATSPEGLVLEELTDHLLLQQLAQQRKDNAALRQLGQQALERADVLRGICALSALTPPARLPRPTRQDNVPAALRRLMGRLLRRRAEYERLCIHEEFGPLYRHLMKHTADSAVSLAVLIGK